MAAITAANLTLAYDRRPAIHHLSLEIPAGSLVAIVGPNGAGKTTLLKAIAGLLKPQEGRIDLHGLQRAAVAYLPQQAEIDRSFPISVRDTVLLGAWHRTGAFGGVGRAGAEAVDRALQAVGLRDRADQPVAALSAGQFQRLLFARTILQDAKLILLDEPFSAIDAATTEILLGLVARWHREGRTVLAVLHDLLQVQQWFPTTLLLARELVALGDTPSVLGPENLERARLAVAHWLADPELCARSAA